jgi:7-cyano-7-deazaguanine tRNA-ribosyltransferase
MYGDVDVDPLEIIQFQQDIGSDIGTILDIFGTPWQSREEAEHGVQETANRAKEALSHTNQKMTIACPVQGGIFPDLRKKCAEDLSELDADFYPIGGVVPLMENQEYRDLITVIIASKRGLPPGKPVHLFGAGHPMVFPIAVALGCDIFDSSAYVKYAQEDRLILPWGTVKLDEIDELPCMCPVCATYSLAELRSQSKHDRLRCLAEHNLYVSMREIKIIRNAIATGNLWELVERKASSHPFLYDAFQELQKIESKQWLERFEPIRKKRALFYTGPQTIHRPLIYRLHNRLLERFQKKSKYAIMLAEKEKPYQRAYSNEIHLIFSHNSEIDLFVNSPLGPVPIWLDEMYPFAQSLFPSKLDDDSRKLVNAFFKTFLKGKKIIYWEDEGSLENIPKKPKIVDESWLDFKRLYSVATMQFCDEAAMVLFDGEIKVVKSKRTGKIRNVYLNGNHVVSMRASDGMFTLKKEGGKCLHDHIDFPRFRVVIDNDAVPFVKDGKSVFSKFVDTCDPLLRPYDECLIVDRNDTLLAVGQCLLSGEEMQSFTYGSAVKNRETVV